MPNRFFARFNLQNNDMRRPAEASLLGALCRAPAEEMQGYLDEFAASQAERSMRLIDHYRAALAPLRGKRVLFIGDSITSDNLGYRPLVTATAGLSAVDISLSGSTSAMLLGAALAAIGRERPDVVSIMMGSNDAVSIGRVGFHQVSLGEYARNLEAMIGCAADGGAKVIAMEVPPIHEPRFASAFGPQNKLHSNPTVALFNAALRDIVQERGLSTVSLRELLGDRDDLFEPDGVHPSAKGHDIIAEKWLQAGIALYKGESA